MVVLALFQFIFMAFIKFAITTAIAVGIAYAFRQKAGSAAMGTTLENLKISTANEGRPLPWIIGTPTRYEAPNVLWYDNLWSYPIRSHDATVGYMLHWDQHVGVCRYAVDGVMQIWYGSHCVWPTVDDATDLAADGTASGFIDAYFVYGGPYREGGIARDFEVLYGAPTQAQNAYLVSKIGDDVPAFRWMVTVLFKGVYWGTTEYPKNLSFIIKATDLLPDGSAQWYPARAVINTYDLNPAHIIRMLLTTSKELGGEGISTSRIGTTFTTVADALYEEGFGLSFAFLPETGNVNDLVDMVLEHIDGVLYEDQVNGTLELALARDDYDVDALPTFTEADFEIVEFQRPTPGVTPARVVLKYSDRFYPDQQPQAIYDDPALVDRQGGRYSEVAIDRPGIYDATLANTVVNREGRQLGAMGATLTLRCKRTMAHLHPCDVVKITYDDPDLSITQMVIRLGQPNYGRPEDEYVTWEAAEDVFATAYTIYGDPQPTEWTRPVETVVSPSSSPSVSPSASASSSASSSVSSSSSATPSASLSTSPSSSTSHSPSTSSSTSPSSSSSA